MFEGRVGSKNRVVRLDNRVGHFGGWVYAEL